ncbi:MAG: hypothetical protein WB760_23250 [Xanthobacteraceae bacterium]
MVPLIIAAFSVAALVCGIRAALLWGQSTRVPVEPEGFEPVVPELRQNWWKIAERKAAAQSGALNRRAACWTAAAAILAFVAVIAGIWPSLTTFRHGL